MSETIRAFIAIPLPEEILAQFDRLQRKLELEFPPRSVRWVRASGIHLTLKFLGDTPTEKIPEIETALAAVARNAPTCTFTVGELGCFPNTNRPRVIWVGVQEPTGRLAALQDAIEEVVEPFGYPKEGRGFSPHLTLGRVNRRTKRPEAAQIGAVVSAWDLGQVGEAQADRFSLIRSVLKPTGAEYSTLRQFALG